ncbi:MAG: hypothetical protein U0X20_23380 [Caldilineaceae bacterium]
MSEAALAGDERFDHLIPLIQERIKFLTEAAPLIDWAFADRRSTPTHHSSSARSRRRQPASRCWRRVSTCWKQLELFTPHNPEEAFRAASGVLANIKVVALPLPPHRAGAPAAPPPLFESMVVLGRVETVRRVKNARAALEAFAAAAV